MVKIRRPTAAARNQCVARFSSSNSIALWILYFTQLYVVFSPAPVYPREHKQFFHFVLIKLSILNKLSEPEERINFIKLFYTPVRVCVFINNYDKPPILNVGQGDSHSVSFTILYSSTFFQMKSYIPSKCLNVNRLIFFIHPSLFHSALSKVYSSKNLGDEIPLPGGCKRLSITLMKSFTKSALKNWIQMTN